MESFLFQLNSLQLLSYWFFPKNEKLMLSYKSGSYSLNSLTCYFVHFNLIHLFANLLMLNVFVLLLGPQPFYWFLWLSLSWTISYLQSFLKQLDPDYMDRWQTGGASTIICAYMTLYLFTKATNVWQYAIKMCCVYFHYYQFFNVQNTFNLETDYIGHRLGHFTGFMFGTVFYLFGNNITQN